MEKTRLHAWALCLVILLLNACAKQPRLPGASSEAGFSSFQFTMAQNSGLAQDITGEIIGDTIFMVTFSGTNLRTLKPLFTFTGSSVLIAGKEQLSGSELALDFSTPLTYTITAADGSSKQFTVKFMDTGLPVAYINTGNITIASRENYIPGNLQINTGLAGDSHFGGAMEIRGRGNSTWDMPKQPFKIKLGKKAPLLGMNESKQWVLLANYADKSLLRNAMGFELSRLAGVAYIPADRFVDVILNGKYIGNYQLTEQIDVGKYKVDIEEQNAAASSLPSISGGYLLEADGFASSEPVHFSTATGMQFSVHYPDDDAINEAQKRYISDHVDKFEQRLFGSSFDDSLRGYKKYFDINAYINCYLVNEIMGNPDIFWSTYLYKKRSNDTIFAGPVWDFDIAANNDVRLGDAVNRLMLDAAHEPKQWINRLMEDRAFRQAVRQRWNELKEQRLPNLLPILEQLAAKLERSQKKNFIRWPILQEKVYLNLQAAGSYEGEVSYLKNHLANRLSWLV